MNGKIIRTDDSEQAYSRDNGSELGPVGLILLFVLVICICPLLIWDAGKAAAIVGWECVRHKKSNVSAATLRDSRCPGKERAI
jgi:hypothetical protein